MVWNDLFVPVACLLVGASVAGCAGESGVGLPGDAARPALAGDAERLAPPDEDMQADDVGAAADGAVAARSGSACAGDVRLRGPGFYPESVALDASGNLYVTSLGTGAVARARPGAATARHFTSVAPYAAGGVLVDDAAGELLVCASDLGFVGRPRVVAFDLKSGAEVARYEFPAAGACSDLARDGAGALYVTDIAAGVIYRAAPGARSLAPWSAPAELAPTAPGQFTANGIAVVGPSLFVVSFATGRLVRIGIGPNGAPGAPVEIAVTPRLELPDGPRRLDDGGLLVAEGVGRLTRLTVLGEQASGEVLAAGLDAPSSVAVAGHQAWVSEGQVRRFFGTDPTPPNLPFRVRRLGLF